MTRELPPGLAEYYKSPIFTDTVPKALTSRHDTKGGVWVRLSVVSGQVTLTIIDSPPIAIASGEQAIIAPQEPHFVKLEPESSFQLTFFRAAT